MCCLFLDPLVSKDVELFNHNNLSPEFDQCGCISAGASLILHWSVGAGPFQAQGVQRADASWWDTTARQRTGASLRTPAAALSVAPRAHQYHHLRHSTSTSGTAPAAPQAQHQQHLRHTIWGTAPATPQAHQYSSGCQVITIAGR